MVPGALVFPAEVGPVRRRAAGLGERRRRGGNDHVEHPTPGGLGSLLVAVGQGDLALLAEHGQAAWLSA